MPTRCLEGPSPALEVPSQASRRAHAGVERRPPRCQERLASASEGPYPHVRGSPAGEERTAAPARERERRVEGGLKVCGGDRYSPTGRRSSAEPLLQGAEGRERLRHLRRWGGADARAKLAAAARSRALRACAGAGVRGRNQRAPRGKATARAYQLREEGGVLYDHQQQPWSSPDALQRAPLPMLSQRARSLYHLLPL